METHGGGNSSGGKKRERGKERERERNKQRKIIEETETKSCQRKREKEELKK